MYYTPSQIKIELSLLACMVGPTTHDPLRLKKHRSPAGFHINSSHGIACPGHGQAVPLGNTELQEFSQAVVQTQAKMEKELSENLFFYSEALRDVRPVVLYNYNISFLWCIKVRTEKWGEEVINIKSLCSAGYAKEGDKLETGLLPWFWHRLSHFALLVLLMWLIQHPAFANCLLH